MAYSYGIVDSKGWVRQACGGVILCRPPNRNKTDFDSLIQRAGDPAQHCQGVAFVIGIFKAADYRCRRANELGQLSLGQARRCPQLVDLAGDLFIRSRLFKAPQSSWLASIEPAVKDLHCIRYGFVSFDHVRSPCRCASTDSPRIASCDLW